MFNAENQVINGISYEQLEKAYDKSCEYLSNVETDSCYYCPYGIEGVEKICSFKCYDKEKVKEYILNQIIAASLKAGKKEQNK